LAEVNSPVSFLLRRTKLVVLTTTSFSKRNLAMGDCAYSSFILTPRLCSYLAAALLAALGLLFVLLLFSVPFFCDDMVLIASECGGGCFGLTSM
jgi:hypothetical protein